MVRRLFGCPNSVVLGNAGGVANRRQLVDLLGAVPMLTIRTIATLFIHVDGREIRRGFCAGLDLRSSKALTRSPFRVSAP